jgi:hypothetical protein
VSCREDVLAGVSRLGACPCAASNGYCDTSVTSRVRIMSPYMSTRMSYLGYMVVNRGTSVPASICQIEQNRTVFPLGLFIGPSI